MPSNKQRVNLTCDPELIFLLEQYREERCPYWECYGTGLATVANMILSEYLLKWKASRAE